MPTLHCDRCKKEIESSPADPERGTAFTFGYYSCGVGSIWAKYVDEGESVICDDCMRRDSRYVRDYGVY